MPDARLDPRTRSHRVAQLREAVIAVPMRLPGRVMGGLVFSVTRGRRFTETDLWVGQTLADQAAVAVQGVQLQDHARARAYEDGFQLGSAATENEVHRALDELLDSAEDAQDESGADQLKSLFARLGDYLKLLANPNDIRRETLEYVRRWPHSPIRNLWLQRARHRAEAEWREGYEIAVELAGPVDQAIAAGIGD